MTAILTVLRSGGEYGPEHVAALRAQIDEYMPGHGMRCLTDVPGVPRSVQLKHDWPGWWAKMALCHPSITGPVLYMDLDTVIVGDLWTLVRDTSCSVVLRDFYRGRRNPEALQSAWMLLTEEDRAVVWKLWMQGPEEWMRREHGDQNVYEAALAGRVKYVQDEHPGAVVSYKGDLNRGAKPPPPDARVVIFHGRPRPWDVQTRTGWSPWDTRTLTGQGG